MIIDGKIKLKSGSSIKRFTETGVEFEDGSKLDADVFNFATGYGDPRGPMRDILGPELGKKLNPVWGIDDEGEIRTAWKEAGLKNCWLMMGKQSPQPTQPECNRADSCMQVISHGAASTRSIFHFVCLSTS